MSTTDSERAEFEAWASTQGFSIRPVKADSDGLYPSVKMAITWNAFQAGRRSAISAPQEGWVSVDKRLPAQRERPYQVVAIATKQYGAESCYPGEGVRTVVQDWVIRKWPQNFTYWMNMPPVAARPQAPSDGGRGGKGGHE